MCDCCDAPQVYDIVQGANTGQMRNEGAQRRRNEILTGARHALVAWARPSMDNLPA